MTTRVSPAGNVLTWQRPAQLDRVTAPQGAPPVVILPGFGNCSTDYTAPFGVQEDAIATFLQVSHARTTHVVVCITLLWQMTSSAVYLAAKRLQRVRCRGRKKRLATCSKVHHLQSILERQFHSRPGLPVVSPSSASCSQQSVPGVQQ